MHEGDVVRRLGLLILLVALVVAVLPPRAWAHNAQVTALINLGVPHPGQESEITIELLDVLGGDIPDAQVRVRFETSNEVVLSTRTLVEQGRQYRGKVSVPAPGPAIFRLEVTLIDGLYAVQFPVQIHANEELLPGAVFELYHSDGGAQTSAGAPAPQPPKSQPAPVPTPAKPSQPATSPQKAPAPTPVASANQATSATTQQPAAPAQSPEGTAQPSKPAPTLPQATAPTTAPGQSADQPTATVPPSLPAASSPTPAADGRYAMFPWVIVAAGVMLLVSGTTYPRKRRR